MPSTYTTDLAIQLMATGENAGTWGDLTNTNLNILQQAIAGYQNISIAGGAQTTALAMTQNALSTARNIVIKLTGTITGNQIVTVPNGIQKTWIISNGTSGAFTVQFKYASTGTGQTWSTTDKGIKILYSDGTDVQTVDLSTISGSIAGTEIPQSTITQTKLAASSVGASQIPQSTITQSKLAANSVGANQLIATAVTPGTYTRASITVDADGRITSASSGAALTGGMEIPVLYSVGPASGTYTANPAATRAGVYMFAGGGGGGGGGDYRSGGTGGVGGYGFYNYPMAQPFAQPYSVGGAGNGGGVSGFNGQTGGAGGGTTITNVGTVNGGNGGNGGTAGGGGQNGNPGSAGNQPGASLTYPSRNFVVGSPYGNSGNGGNGGGGGFRTGNPGNPGSGGVLVIFENTGS
jgi:hypothetical protein